MAADPAATHATPTSDAPASPAAPASSEAPEGPAYTPPNPIAQSEALLRSGHDLLGQALDRLNRGDPAGTAALVGQASDRVGSALHFIRQAQRR